MSEQFFEREPGNPLYLQLKHHLLRRIQAGEWQEGQHIPTEAEMKEEYGLSRATVRQALEELESEGYIERKRRFGTIVSRQRIKPELLKLTSFTEDVLARGLSPESKTLDVDFVTPPLRAREAFRLEPQEKVWRIRRLRSASGEPFGLHELYLPPTLQFSPRDLSGMVSYYKLLEERHGLKPANAAEHLTASVANKQEAALLKIAEGAPLLVAWRTTFDENNQIIECVKILYRADRYEYTIQLVA